MTNRDARYRPYRLPQETRYTTTEGGRRISVARKQRLDASERRRTDGPTPYTFVRNAASATIHVSGSWKQRALCGAVLGEAPVAVEPPDRLEACCLKCVTSGYHMPILPKKRG